jgi:hypothetical protein
MPSWCSWRQALRTLRRWAWSSWRRAGARCDPQTVDGQDTVDPFDSEHLVVGADERYEYVGG